MGAAKPTFGFSSRTAAEAAIAVAEKARNARQAALSQIDAHPDGAPADG